MDVPQMCLLIMTSAQTLYAIGAGVTEAPDLLSRASWVKDFMWVRSVFFFFAKHEQYLKFIELRLV